MEKNALLTLLEANKNAAALRNFPAPAERVKRLAEILELLRSHRDAVFAALQDDLGKNEFDALTGEYLPLLKILKYLIRNTPSLSRPRRCGVSIWNLPGNGVLYPEPYGHVLVVATWNYPLLLALEPVLGAYAAGNRVTLKLSERSPHTMQLIRWLLETAFPGGEVAVIDHELNFEETLAFGYDYVFYTGSVAGGTEVLKSCASFLTPATLELGGKNPCIVARGAHLKVAARRIVWGKFTNAGQTCTAPDYLLVDRELKDPLTAEIKKALKEFYGEQPLANAPRVVDAKAYDRLSELAEHGRLISGGDKDPGTLRIAPTVIDRLEPDDPLLREEIFGPLLPVEEYASEEELFGLLARHPQSLALYCFGGGEPLRERLLRQTSSGAVVFNDVLTHFLNFNMPFGGVGRSGMGAYHGRRTFETFVHLKPVMRRAFFPDFALRYPPMRLWLTRLLKILSE